LIEGQLAIAPQSSRYADHPVQVRGVLGGVISLALMYSLLIGSVNRPALTGPPSV
jgi:hypothetical protein